ncbi:hypothetical protein [Nocardiopsis sp. NRRL B-16309]|uniref:hypothetical protein n=1 Tax=Nocardiopsis sp. NRRL B-16309 TaxID=1519494 RepID=UPI0006ADCC0B|nr:hypothetical protein [Nocardiopsis sp. NRRL B-16309]KOX09963.1 hypothetical protein ADL05_24725 [Nocardiopsis sp. NRRL B-16309]
MSPRTPESALPALGALLDRSLVQIADAAHTFDHQTVTAVADVWDNNTFPLFRAATGRSARQRERRARAALEWMARLSPQRRAWMVEQTAIAGYRIDTHLSGTGRRAEARVPPRQGGGRLDEPPQKGELTGSTLGAATFLLRAMVLIRSVGHSQEAARVPLAAYCRALRGAGQDILSAGARPRRQRETAFRSLIAAWLRRGGPDLVRHWNRLLVNVPDARELAREVRDDLSET